MGNDRYYASRYLNVVDLGDGRVSLLFNGVNGCLDEVAKELGDVLSSGNAGKIEAIPRANLNFLADRGHVTALDPMEELRRFRDLAAALHAERSAQASFGGLLLLLSYRCNLSCSYCFQQNNRTSRSGAAMSSAMVDGIFGKHLEKMFPGKTVKDLYLYGGEPFLPANEPAIRAALLHAKAGGMVVKAITNATMLDRMADVFGPDPGQVSWVQISLDGAREDHDASRVPRSGKPTFDTILANIRLLLGQGTKVAIRLNLDRKKLAALPALLADLRSEGIVGNPLVTMYASPLHDNLGTVDTSEFLGVDALADTVCRLGTDLDNPISLRATELDPIFDIEKGLGLNHTSYCMQATQNTLVVDPFGDIYACFEEAGATDRRVGRLDENGVDFFPLRDVYQTRHLANLPTCLECSVALACGGHCGVTGRAKTGDLFKPDCGGTKQIILQGLKLAYEKRTSVPREAVPTSMVPVDS